MSAREAIANTLVAEVHRDGTTSVRVDLAAVDFLDSSALRALLGGFEAARAVDRAFTVVGARAHVRRVLDITGVLPILCPDEVARPAGRDRMAG